MHHIILLLLSSMTSFMIVSCSRGYDSACLQPITGDDLNSESGQLVSLNVSLINLMSDQADSLHISQAHFVEGTCGYHIYLNIDNTYIRFELDFACTWNLQSTQSSEPMITFASYGFFASENPYTEEITHPLPSSFRGIIFHVYFPHLVAEGRIEASCIGYIGGPVYPVNNVIFSMEINGCPSGTYGVNCSHHCSCADGIECHSFNGVCMCPKGLSGDRCDVAEPYVEVDSKHIYAKWGLNLTLECTAHGIINPGPLISWQLNGRPLSTSYFRIETDYFPRPLSIVHIINNVTDLFNGEYRCIVEENLIENVNITAIGLPEPFLNPPFDQTVVMGENVTINCKVRKNAGTVKWTRDGKDLNNVTEIQITKKTDITFDENSRVSTLKIISAEVHDESMYRCYVGHTFGTGDVNFIEAYLNVVVPPTGNYPVLEGVNDTEALSVVEGDLISITCAVHDVKPTPVLIWSYWDDDAEIDAMYQTLHVSQQPDGINTVTNTLKLPAHFEDNVKEIACWAVSDSFGSAIQSIHLNISYAPKVYIEPESIDISTGDALTVECLGSSNPTPITYRWECTKRNGDVIHQVGQIFSVLDVSSDFDQSSLRCVASNSVGSNYAIKFVNVRGSGILVKIILPVSAFVLLVLVLVIPAVVYIRKKKSTIPHVIPTQKKEFDVFISYKGDTDEEIFVIRRLVPKLEELGYRVCVHYKHFIGGKTIIENIIESIAKSHMTMIVLSRAFVESEWCRFEFQSASTEMPNFENTIIPIMFEDVTELPNLQKTLKDLLKRVNYIRWPRDCENDDASEKQFWKLVKKALRPIVNSETNV